MKYVIKESRWLHGEGATFIGSFLLRSDEKMCCLGFVCKQFDLNVTDDNIINRACPSEFVEDYSNSNLKLPEWLVDSKVDCDGDSYFVDTKDCLSLMSINDDDHIFDDLRKILIANIFAKHGDEIVFEE